MQTNTPTSSDSQHPPVTADPLEYATMALLHGAGLLPSPRSQELVMAHFNSAAAISNGVFEDPAVEARARAIPNLDQPAHLLQVLVPLSRENAKLVPIEIRLDTSPKYFLARIIANMDLDQNTARLGWRSCDDNKASVPCRLQTPEDVRYAFREMAILLENPRRKKPVYMEIVNLTEPPAPRTASPEIRECTFSKELKIVKEKLKCAIHKGANRWCYVKPSTGEHCPLGIAELALWARRIHDGYAERDCTVPPNTWQLDHLAEKKSERGEGLSRRTVGTAQPSTGTKRARNIESSSDEEVSKEGTAIPIEEVLASLHLKRPTSNYPQYKTVLKKAGVIYASTALDLDPAFYEGKEIGMPRGAVGDFLRAVKRAMSDRKSRNLKRGRTEDSLRES